MSTHTVTVTEIADTTRRVARTVVQVGIPAFLSLAGALPALLPIVHVAVGPRLWVLLAATAAAITTAAGVLTRFMAIPAVNELLDRLNLAGQSTVAAPLDTETRLLSLQAVTSDASH